jgi:hypothetical protein
MDNQIEQTDMWATVELMGHAQTAGRISRPADFGGLLRVDVPIEDTREGPGTGDLFRFRTEFYGMTAIYAIKIVSEEIARAYVRPVRGVISYDAPIVTREQHESAMRQAEDQNYQLRAKIQELERRLTAVKALPAEINDQPVSILDARGEIPF